MMAVGGWLLTVSLAMAQSPPATPVVAKPPDARVHTAARAVTGLDSPGQQQQRLPGVAEPRQPEAAEHPLMPTLRWALQELPRIEALKDYSALLVKRERVNGVVGLPQYMAIKIRHTPFSVYANFLSPTTLKGQEVLYVRGQNDDKVWGHRGDFGTMKLSPDSDLAMRGQHYPISEIGLTNLVSRLVEVGREDVRYGECEVKYFSGAKINGRVCTLIQVVHPVPREHFRFHLARIFVDDELKLPVRYESHDWPQQPGGESPLIEEYTYLDLKLNNGFTDADFSITNPQYHFPPRKP